MATAQECSDQCETVQCFSWSFYWRSGLCQHYGGSSDKVLVSSPGDACGATDDDANYVSL